MKYIKVTWIHEFEDEPVLFYHEINEEGFEDRKIEIFKNDRIAMASNSFEFGGTFLSYVHFPPIEEINEDPEFIAKEISALEFEEVWNDHIGIISPD